MIVDSSALVAILFDEAERSALNRAIDSSPAVRISAVSLLETSIVVGLEGHEALDGYLDEGDIAVVPFDAAQARVARAAYTEFGKGSRSPARLNFGDCMAYALAKVTGEPLLFKGDDFTHTDIVSARD